MSMQFGCLEGRDGHHSDVGLPRLEEGIPCAC